MERVSCKTCGFKVDYSTEESIDILYSDELHTGKKRSGDTIVYSRIRAYCINCGNELFAPAVEFINSDRRIDLMIKRSRENGNSFYGK